MWAAVSAFALLPLYIVYVAALFFNCFIEQINDDDDDEVEQPKISELQHPCGHPLLHLIAMNFAHQ